jgi:hypothetical protein
MARAVAVLEERVLPGSRCCCCASGSPASGGRSISPFGYALRAARDSPLRAEASGIDVRATQVAAFTSPALAAGVAGALYAFSKGSISPERSASSARWTAW